ncbi:MAG: hypothetical protein KatS3mg113_0951 [Planctomycetaceae bacterium]|nr:MAG: hypothetical protein KatS3mg113_0951 [Planctomycetaceae bacterium]
MYLRYLRFITDEQGFVVSSELILIATVAVLGILTGLATVRDQVVIELIDVAAGITAINQSFSWSAITAHSGSVAGSLFEDLDDFCDEDLDQGSQAGPGTGICLQIDGSALDE